MTEFEDLIPRPPIVRERLARNYREAARLRRLLRLAEAAAADQAGQTAEATAPARGREVAR